MVVAGATQPDVAQASGRFLLVRSSSGSRVTQDGQRLLVEDPRTVFNAQQDRQVLVLFEWRGPAGRHHCEAKWKDPSGQVVFTSATDVDARGARFSAYFGLSLPDTVATGTWVVEATVNGEAAGVHALQIVAAPADPGAPPPRRALAVADLYQKGLAATLTIDVVDAAGAPLGFASGVFVAPDTVLTTFSVLNGARKVRVRTSDGRRLETDQVVAWNRREDWALLRVAGGGAPALERAPERPAVGERCYFIDAQSDGSRAIVEATVAGQSGAGDLLVNRSTGGASSGAPVLNDYGEAIGTAVGPAETPGATTLDLLALGPDLGTSPRGGRVRGFPSLPADGAPPQTFADLDRAGEFVRALVPTDHSVHGILGGRVERQGRTGVPVVVDQRFRFSRREKSLVVFVTWTPARKEEASMAFDLFDPDNRRVNGTEPTKSRLRTDESFVQYWTVPLSTLTPGIYRIDLRLGPDPVWRTFFRVTE